MYRWHMLGLVSLAVLVLALPLWVARNGFPSSREHGFEIVTAEYVGREACLPCHKNVQDTWAGSDHDRAMDLALEETVLGNFNDSSFNGKGGTTTFYRQDDRFLVETPGPDGEVTGYEVTHVFGFEPLQQYLVPFPGGRLQCLNIAWDTEKGEWFDLAVDQDAPPGDWLHWTGAGQNWNGMCAECHSTNLRKAYDPATDSYDTTFSEIDVSCEACHGPGSQHVEWANIQPMARPDLENYGLPVQTSGLQAREQVELCAPCHSRRSEMGDFEHAQDSLLDTLSPTLLQERLYHADGQILDEVFVYGSFLQSKMYSKDVRCSDCHDVHSLKLVKEGNALCLQCHEANAYDSKEHHFHKKIHEGKPSDGALCVKCHMPEATYMGVDERADHSIRVPRPDLGGRIGAPDACSGCHGDKPRNWVLEAYTKWYGLARKPHFGDALYAG
jgi:predicted CXXCH cytochrome family protein